MEKRKNIQKIFLQMLPIALGLLFFALSFSSFSHTKNLLQQGIEVKGKMVKFTISSDSDTGDSFTPIYEFRSQKGFLHEYEGFSVSSKSKLPKMGTSIDLVYMPGHLSNVKELSFWGLYLWAVVFLALALPILFYGFANLRFRYVHLNKNLFSNA